MEKFPLTSLHGKLRVIRNKSDLEERKPKGCYDRLRRGLGCKWYIQTREWHQKKPGEKSLSIKAMNKNPKIEMKEITITPQNIEIRQREESWTKTNSTSKPSSTKEQP